jgi:hemolysin activation/secretion protein
MKKNSQAAFKILPVFFLSGIILSHNVFADSPPSGQGAGPLGQRFQQESQQLKKQIEQQAAKTPEIQKEKAKGVAAPESNVSFILKEVVITGATVFNTKDFLPAYQPYLNHAVTLKDINLIVDRISAVYKKKGYFTTIVALPEQNIKNGKLEIQVFEGKMGALKIEGNKKIPSSLIAKYFHIKEGRLLDFQTLQRDLLRLDQSGALSLKAVVGPGEAPQTSDVTLKINENRFDHMALGFDNQGTRLTGIYRESAWWYDNNVSGRLDSLYLYLVSSSLTLGETASYERPLNTYGLKGGVDFTNFNMKLGKEFKPYDITGHTVIADPHLSLELALSEDFQASARTGIEIKSIKLYQDRNIIANDQLRTPYVSFDFSKIDPYGGKTEFAPKFSLGTAGFLGSSSQNNSLPTREGAGGPFFKYDQSLNRIQQLPAGVSLEMRSQFQEASRTLPSSEQFQLGGVNSVRAYPEGDYMADWGGSVNLDLYFPLYFIPEDLKMLKTHQPLRSMIQPEIFFDAGGGALRKTLPGEVH